jgi:hypothetical protein
MNFQCPLCKQVFNRDMRIRENKSVFKYYRSMCDKFGGKIVKCKPVGRLTNER